MRPGGKKKKKDTVYNREKTIDGIPAKIIVKEIMRKQYRSEKEYFWGVTVTLNPNTDKEVTHRRSVKKTELNRTFIQKLGDKLFNRSPTTSISDLVIEVADEAVEKYRDTTNMTVSVEQEIESAVSTL